jgi:hypothetical protein
MQHETEVANEAAAAARVSGAIAVAERRGV